MALLKSYTCSKCGGILIFDSDQEYFDCPFCGTRFDAVDFHGEELLSQAIACLAQRDFVAAKDKYQLILGNDPYNFEALRGLVLCEAGLTSPEELKDPDNFKKNGVESVDRVIDYCFNNSDGAQASYFSTLDKMASLVKDIKTLENERSVVKKDENRGRFKRASTNYEVLHRYRIGTTVALAVMLVLSLIYTTAKLLMLGSDDSSVGIYFIMPILFFLVYGVYMFVFTIKGLKAEKPYKEVARIGATEGMTVHNRIEDIKASYAEEYEKLVKFEADLGKAEELDNASAASNAESEKRTITADPSKTVICSKCGAQLALNNDKRVYECNSCGVAYGISLFFGLPLEKALDSMNHGNYQDAEQRFTNILMADPSDFEALLGLILCKGRWTNISGIKAAEELTPTSIKRIQMLVAESAGQALPEDKQYFEDLNNLLSALVDCTSVDYKIKTTSKQIGDYDAKERVYASVQSSDDNFDRKEKMLLDRSLKELNEKKSSAERNLTSLKNKLLCSRSDSMLTK